MVERRGVFQHLFPWCLLFEETPGKEISRLFAEGSIHVMSYLTSEIGLQNAKDYQGQKEVKNTLGN